MASTVDKLTIAEFEQQYGDSKPYHEYWFGEAVPKAMPTWLHSLLQKILMNLLDEAGYESGAEVRLKLSTDFEPLPDVIATAGELELPYPTKPFDVVIELLSPDDYFRRVIRKCKLYAEWGILLVVVLDPETREGWAWDKEGQTLRPIGVIVLPNGKTITLEQIFGELDTRLKRRRS